jgi:cyclophilin family peptidyl-prolyl cis-trans isomerase
VELDTRQRKVFHDLTRRREVALFWPFMHRIFPRILFALLLAVALVSARAGTKVRIATPVGNIDLELYDADKPVTVQNFLNYVQSGRYANSFAHRLEPGFVLQSGGYYLNGSSVTSVTTDAPIVNEYATGTVYSNVKGTIAMAKVDGDPDSATSQWFLNLGDNSANLDNQNGGFTVFGHVIAGMDVLELFNSAFGNGASGGWGVYDASSTLGGDFGHMPLLANQLTTDNLIYSAVSVLPDPTPTPTPTPTAVAAAEGDEAPTVALKGRPKLVTKAASAKLSGTGASSVAKIEWRLGTKGRLRVSPAHGTWKVRITGLRKGVNIVFVRGISASGRRGAFVKIRIMRK